MSTMTIDGRPIGDGHPVYVVAEISANHLKDLSRARALIEAAAAAGADAVKLQTYTPDTITLDAAGPHFVIEGTLWEGKTLHALYGEAYTPWSWHGELFALARSLGITCFSSPFDPTAVDLLESLGAPAYKVASFELVDLPLLRRIGATQKPIILSTGMAELFEIDEAVRTVRAHSTAPMALLRTSSGYPAAPEEMDLATIPHLSEAFEVVAGLSDHTLGIAVPVAAVALGAKIIEKHLTLSRADGGPDAAFSLEPQELTRMIEAVRVAERAIGRVRYGPTERERPSLAFRRSLFVVEDVPAGAPFTETNVRSIRPAAGLHPRHLPLVLTRRAARDIARGTPLTWELIG